MGTCWSIQIETGLNRPAGPVQALQELNWYGLASSGLVWLVLITLPQLCHRYRKGDVCHLHG
jgi:hypothetical protein